jgi:uncharacterized protein involved in outer membrane biogenesis
MNPAKPKTPATRLTRLRKVALWLGGAVALYAAVGFLIAPPIARHQLERTLSDLLGRTVTIERVRINPFALTASVHGFKLKERDGSGDAVSFDELHANVSLASLFRLAPVVEAVRLSRPQVRVARYEDKTYSFQDIVDKFAGAPAAPPAPPGPPLRFAVYNISITDGRVDFDDRPEKAQHAVTDLRLGVPFVSSLPHQVDITVQPLFSAKVNGTPLEIAGETKPFKETRETTWRFDVDDLQLAKYLNYSPVPLKIRVPSGSLDAKLVLTLAMLEEKLQSLTLSGSANLRKLVVQEAGGAPLVAVDALAVDLEALDLVNRRAAVKSVRIDAPQVDVTRRKSGEINLVAAIPAAPAAPAPREKADEAPFAFSVAEIALTRGAVRFTDESLEKLFRVVLQEVSINAGGLGNAPDAKARVRLVCYTPTKGKIAYDGTLRLTPIGTEGKVDVAGVRLAAFAPYIEEAVNVALTAGALSAQGALSVAVPEGKPLRAAYRGDIDIANFESLDRPTRQDLLAFKSLAVRGIDFDLAPLKVGFGEAALADFRARVIVNADGSLNFRTLLARRNAGEPAPSAPPPAAASAPPADIRLGRIALRDGSVNYSDYFVRPNVSVLLTGIAGEVTEMAPDKAGEVALRGRIGETASVEIGGKVNPLAPELALDLTANVRDIELSPLSPYSIKYAGYGIERGKLSLKLTYQIDHSALKATNNIYLEQLAFGERVDSPTATKLPVPLIVALFKDRNGVIDLNLPISGSLDNPEFSLGSAIGGAVGNLFSKAAASPFAALGALVGGGEELAYVEFAPGAAQPEQETKLKSLAKALDARPGLKLEVSGRIDPEADRAGLQRAELQRQIKAAKLRESGAKTFDASALAAVTIAPSEYEKYLAAAYRAATFERPKTEAGALKELPPGEMERLMLANVQVSDDDLRALGNARAQATKDWLVKEGKITAERIVVAAPKIGAEGIKDSGKPTRVDFALK